MYRPITTVDQIDAGMPLSDNFMIEHMTTGAFHSVMGKWIPQFPARLSPWQPNGIYSPNVPLLQVVQNLQLGTQGLLERLLTHIGGDLIIRSGFRNNLPLGTAISEVGHLIGSSLDIAVANYTDNPYAIAGDIQKLAYSASGINMIFGASSSWFHLDFNPQSVFNPSVRNLPSITSIDLVAGVSQSGIVSYRGFV